MSLLKLGSAIVPLAAWLTLAGSLAGCSSSSGSTIGTVAGAAGALGGSSGGSAASNGGGAGLSGSAAGAGGTLSGGAGGSNGAQAGSGSSVAGASSAGGGATGACPANAIFCADFESGSIPSAAVYFPAYQQSTIATYMTVDATVAHGGSHSLKVTPGSNFSQMLGVVTGTPTFWTRVYLRQDINTSTVMGHDTFVAATDADGDPNNGEHIRIGEHSCQLELNRKSDDKEILSDALNGSSNYTCGGGITFMPNTWYCVEALYDGPNSTVRVFVDSTEVTALHVTDWGPYTYKMFKFGFENYGGTPRNLWYDDVVIAPQQVGCN